MTGKKPPSKNAQLKILYGNLRYWQMMYRMGLSGNKRIKDRQLEIVQRIKELKSEK